MEALCDDWSAGAAGKCPAVEPPKWGSVRERVLTDGTLQTVYSCEPGRRLRGHKLLTCTKQGWNHPMPECVPTGQYILLFGLTLIVSLNSSCSSFSYLVLFGGCTIEWRRGRGLDPIICMYQLSNYG
ncbi:hypothetical protein QAD02_004112 [Eretmocerus hayati]|uniref:Uncharacterized protein n=1 Tax=Eretmocerus hayati TaxID=131215 RepID=A0ACC2NRK6_9HYME|nr:hypothetical protein QAD02_004112 [Eretmocerus hayati]